MNSKSLVLLLLFSLILLHDASADISHAHAHLDVIPTRKMMMVKKEKVLGLNEELRTVPSGPDPLHHHVNPPRQPRTDSHLP
ncbi:unnamed protein product [Microthlaspi erraticum]|uniref:Uncharacterized protein n=1 Tax=Microthlaspi erraticum TaxID=1685480 RepID=A0A6D2I2U7_9BRAS|nr:unnamed protein product [Microthlaspi erraticum]